VSELKFEGREELEAWLIEEQREVSIAIAARAALRLAPRAASDAPRQGNTKAFKHFLNLTFSIFFATALTRAVAKSTNTTARANELRAVDAAGAARAAAYFRDEDSDEGVLFAPRVIAADAAADAAYAAARAGRGGRAAAARVAAADDGDGEATEWGAICLDVNFIADGGRAKELSDRPLWLGEVPAWAAENWAKLCAALPPGEDWEVWTRWYDDILAGRPHGEAHDLIFATVPEELRQTPAAANAWIKEQLAKLESEGGEEPRVPPQKPAAIEPVFRDGKIALPAEGAEADLDAEALDAALTALRALVARLAKDIEDEANIDKRATALLRHLGESIPISGPTQAQLFEIAHELEGLEDYGKKVVAEWPDVLASRYFGVLRAFDGTMRQFEKWRLFKQNALKDRLTQKQRESAPIAARQIAVALREAGNAEFVEREIADTIEEMARRLEQSAENTLPRAPDEASADTRPEDLLTSSENIVKRIGEAAIDAKARKAAEGEKGYAGKVGRGFAIYVKDGDKVGEDIGKWATRTLIGGGASALSFAVYELMEHYPAIAQWLRPIIQHLTH
jgi:hypothetical protein